MPGSRRCAELSELLSEADAASTLLYAGHHLDSKATGRRDHLADKTELLECEQMLLYLTKDTWTSGPASEALANEVEVAMTAGVRLLLVHEAPSWDKSTPNSGPFEAFFACEHGTSLI